MESNSLNRFLTIQRYIKVDGSPVLLKDQVAQLLELLV